MGGHFDSWGATGLSGAPLTGDYNAATDCVWDGHNWVASQVIQTRRVSVPTRPSSHVEMIEMRLGKPHGFDHLNVFRSTKTFIFIVQGEQATLLEDDHDLFPSDKLITQLRLMK